MNDLKVFTNRMKRIGINLELVGNYPWIYLDKINGIKVQEKFHSEHYFTIAFTSVKFDGEIKLTDLKEIFKLIRKYTQK